MLHLLYERCAAQVQSIGIGDSRNDVSMLHTVEHPVFLGHRNAMDFLLPAHTIFYKEKGPSTWARAVTTLLSSLLETR